MTRYVILYSENIWLIYKELTAPIWQDNLDSSYRNNTISITRVAVLATKDRETSARERDKKAYMITAQGLPE